MQIKRKGAQVKQQPQLQVQEMQMLMLMPYANNAKRGATNTPVFLLLLGV